MPQKSIQPEFRLAKATQPLVGAALALYVSLVPAFAATSSLPQAAEIDDTPAILQALAFHAPLDAQQADGMTALLWTIFHDNTEAAVALIEAGADVSLPNRYGVFPLSLACQNGNESVVKALLEAGADSNASKPSGETVLMTAARTGLSSIVEALLAAGAIPDTALPNGQTALVWATTEGHLEVVSLLIEAGADHLSPLESGYTPFFFAIRQGHVDLVRYFLDLGCDVNATMQVQRRGSKLPRNGTSPLVLALENGHLELATELLDRGADPTDDRTGQTPLHLLVRVRKPDRGEGADGEPPPPILGGISTLDFARDLVSRGADVNARIQTDGNAGGGRLGGRDATPFLLACDTADIEYMKLLVELGADPFLPNAAGTTPLMAAAGIGSFAPEEEAGTPAECLEAVRYLVSLGADVNTVNANGETAMHGAAYKNAPEIVRFLDSIGADIQVWNTKNSQGWYPLYIAEGYRLGNFKPSFETIDAIEEVMLANDVPIPSEERPVHVNYSP